jgi:hypothetical protein
MKIKLIATKAIETKFNKLHEEKVIIWSINNFIISKAINDKKMLIALNINPDDIKHYPKKIDYIISLSLYELNNLFNDLNLNEKQKEEILKEQIT